MAKQSRTKRTDAVRKKFIETLRQTCNVSESARTAGIGRRTAYEWRDAEPSFAAEWYDAEQEAADKLEREAWRRAVEGTDKPVTFQGEITASYKEYSDRMLELLLKAHRPEKFADRNKIEHTGKDGISLADEAVNAAEHIREKLARLAQE